MDNQHSQAQNERERIVKELQDKFYWIPTGPCANEIATWHLAEVKRILEPLVEHKKGYPEGSWEAMLESKIFYTVDVIDETLKRANGGESLTPTGSDQ